MKLATALALLAIPSAPLAALGASFAANPTADAFVTTGPSGNLSGSNYGGAGAVALSAPGSAKGEFQSVLRFDLAAAAASFDAAFGAGRWTVETIALQHTATSGSHPIFNASAAGTFQISWMQNDSWLEGSGTPAAPVATGITFASLQSTYIGAADEVLGTFGFDGSTSGASDYLLGLTPGFLADVLAGNAVSLRLLAPEGSTSGVFYSRSFGTASSRPLLTVVAVPEPDPRALCGLGLVLFGVWRRSPAPFHR